METLSKSEFSRHCGVSPARVSQWIKEGKIDGDALVGEGRSARINVLLAEQQLTERLDPNQKLGINGLRSGALTSDQPAAEESNPAPAVTATDRIAEEKRRQAEMTTRRMAREDALAAGRYVRAADHKAAVGEALQRLMQTIEGGLTDMAMAVAADCGVDRRQVDRSLRKAFRDVRARASASFRDEADAEPAMVQDVAEEPRAAGTA